MPKTVVFAADERSKTREWIEVKVRSMGDGELARLQEFLKNCKNQAREFFQTRFRNSLIEDISSLWYCQTEKLF
ncbi:MAG: hypothetical protein WAN47_11330 [Nitrosotalea sp.]